MIIWKFLRHLTITAFLIGANIKGVVGSEHLKDNCRRQEFIQYTGYAYTGKYLVYDGPWPYHVCQRLCRQYLECTTFVMRWAREDARQGYCGLIRDTPPKSMLSPSDQCTIYGPAPQPTRIAFTTPPCVASSARSSNNSCHFALDGLLDTGWKTKTRNSEQEWMAINLTKPEFIAAIGIDPGCALPRQCRLWLVTFTDNTQHNISRKCSIVDCESNMSEVHFINPGVFSDFVNMTCLEKCQDNERTSVANIYILTPFPS